MKKLEIFNAYCEVLDDLLENNNFMKYYLQNPTSLVHGFSYKNVTIDCGITKGCISIAPLNYIVKFNLTEDNYHFCEKEQSIYWLAKRAGFGQYFPETMFIGTYSKTIHFWPQESFKESSYDCEEAFDQEFETALKDKTLGELEDITINLPLFAYEKCDIIGVVEDESINGIIFPKNTTSPLLEIDKTIAKTFIDCYGYEEFYDFSKFLALLNIHDLHNNNCGFVNERFVILDFSSLTSSIFSDIMNT